ncbi:MAG: nucleotidyltransferase domain-containing protein [Candidatus Harrisonbacteria bacterium]|nr:nucleotidyltransferase domain-containing protein [Candidatus Harrisonbacteria bacterium]
MNYYEIQNQSRKLLSWFLDIRSKILDLDGEHRVYEIAEIIACNYRNLNINFPKNEVIVSAPQITNNYFNNDSEYRKPVKDLFNLVNRELSPFVSQFYLHGSLATEDYKKGWSDLDTFMVINGEVVLDAKKLIKLREICFNAWPIFLEITPLQHHGFIIITELDTKCYSNSFLPTEVFKLSLAMKNNQPTLKLLIRDDDGLSKNLLLNRLELARESANEGIFKYHPHNGKYLLSEFRNANDSMHQLFSFLGNNMNAPIYFLDSIGKGCHKKESFLRARSYFSDEAWSVIDKASIIRDLWPDKEGQRYRGNAIPKWVMEILGKNYIKEAVTLWEEAVSNV